MENQIDKEKNYRNINIINTNNNINNSVNNNINNNQIIKREEGTSDKSKNQRFIFNKGFMVILLDSFNDEFIYYEHKEVRRKKFINIIYKSPTIFLNGLTFETPWMTIIKNCYPIINNETKYWLEQTFIGYKNDSEINLFLQVINNIDKNVINYLDSYKNYLELNKNNDFFDKKSELDNEEINYNYNNKNLNDIEGEDLFCKNMKENTDNEDKYLYLKSKVDIYLKNIIVNNEKYEGTIADLKLKNSFIKTTITCSGLWKYNNKCGMSWKVIKMNVISNNNDTVKNNNNNQTLIKKIPNFELESDPEYINKINKIR